jgi:hypothetical protein
LKHFAARLQPSTPFSLTHDLLDNWAVVSKALQESDAVPANDRIVIDVIGDILEEFVEIDAKGEEFRYPESKKKQPNLVDTAIVNLEILRDAMEIIERHFDQWASKL